MAEETETPESSEEESFNSSDSFLFKGAIEIFPYDELSHLSKQVLSRAEQKGRKAKNISQCSVREIRSLAQN